MMENNLRLPARTDFSCNNYFKYARMHYTSVSEITLCCDDEKIIVRANILVIQ
jgi:hypothetical protein